jgi:hypothetical protein
VTSPTSDHAELSSLRALLDDALRRIDGIAAGYRNREDTMVASDLETAERSLVATGRAIDRALKALASMR